MTLQVPRSPVRFVLAIALITVGAAPTALTAPTASAEEPAEVASFATPQATWSEADWSVFSQNLVAGLAGDNEGVQLSALQMIVRYGEHLDVRDAEFDVVTLFRSHEDQRVRRLAAVACSQLKSGWAMGFLRMSESFEKDARVRATIRSLTSDPS